MKNRNETTLVAYGVASLNSLADWVWEEFTDNGASLTAREIEAEFYAENPGETELPESFWDDVEITEECFELETDGMKLGLSWLGGAPIVWVFESPHMARFAPCSPCVPGAGDLDSPEPDGVMAYCLPGEWTS